MAAVQNLYKLRLKYQRDFKNYDAVVKENAAKQQQGAYATGRLEDSGRQSDEKMSRETVHSQSYATFFRHSAVLSLSAVLLRQLPSSNDDGNGNENVI